MDDDTTELASAIGARVKGHRQALGWTLDRLAQTATVSRRTLVNVEQGAANPSVGTLLRLADALGVGLPALVAPARPRPLKVTRRGEGGALWAGEAGGRGVLVATGEAPEAFELWDWTLAPGDRRQSEAHAADTEELLQIQEGTVVVEAAGERVELSAGDAVAFPGDSPHAYVNPGPGPARFVLAVLEPAPPRRTKADR